ATMLRAFRHVRDAVPGAVLLVVGDGHLRASLEAVAEAEGVADSVRFLGDRGDVPRLVRGFEVFWLSSLTAGYSIALMAACAGGGRGAGVWTAGSGCGRAVRWGRWPGATENSTWGRSRDGRRAGDRGAACRRGRGAGARAALAEHAALDRARPAAAAPGPGRA